MKWIFAIRYKLKAAAVLSILLLMVFTKNMMDNKNMDNMGTTFISVYEDRLVVENYIFKISEELFKIRLLIANPSLPDRELINRIDESHLVILRHIQEVEKTKLTESEAFYLKDLKDRIESVVILEMQLASSCSNDISALEKHISKSMSDLEVLAEIQLEEGKKLVNESEKIVLSSGIWHKFELGTLFILLIVIYVLIFTDLTLNSRLQKDFSLN